MISEIIFFCYGDSNKSMTWSNVPYLFTKTLISKRIIIHRVDISPNKYIGWIYNKFIYPITKKTGNYCSFRYSKILSRYTNDLIKRSVLKYPNADYCIFTSFDYYNKFSDIKTLLFCDWTYDVLINERLGRKATKKEERFLVQQKEAITSADFVVSIFPECAKHIRQTYPKANVKYIDGYVINSFYEGHIDYDDIVHRKKSSKTILFIGTKKYKETALKIIEALKLLSEKGLNLPLNIIGMTDKEFKNYSDLNINCYGYLRKDVSEECKMYYNILLNSSVVVNCDPLWGGISSIVEAMYFYTPIVVAPYNDFTKLFGKDIPFGEYNQEYSSECIAGNISKIIQSEDYNKYCLTAHNAVKNFTWNTYVDKLLNIIDDDK